MKSFSTVNGDVVVENTIKIVEGSELLRQKVERVIGTNLKEWIFDKEEGIDFSVIFCKNPNEDEIRDTIENALTRIDNTFAITDFNLIINKRKATVEFHAVNADGEEVGGEYTYGS